MLIDFDAADDWAPTFGSALRDLSSGDLEAELRSSRPEFIEDARDIVERLVGTRHLISGLNERLASHSVRLWHATRLTEAEIEKVRVDGLRPLLLSEREAVLAPIFAGHPRWTDVQHRFQASLASLATGVNGFREDGCVHACFSRAGLLGGCSHYLAFGAEVDGHIGHLTFGDSSVEPLLAGARRPWLIAFELPFGVAAEAANPYGGPPLDSLEGSLLGKLISVWAYRAAHPGYSPASLRDCTAAQLPGPIPADRLTFIPVRDDEIDERGL